VTPTEDIENVGPIKTVSADENIEILEDCQILHSLLKSSKMNKNHVGEILYTGEKEHKEFCCCTKLSNVIWEAEFEEEISYTIQSI
jgi:hypothetical protein